LRRDTRRIRCGPREGEKPAVFFISGAKPAIALDAGAHEHDRTDGSVDLATTFERAPGGEAAAGRGICFAQGLLDVSKGEGRVVAALEVSFDGVSVGDFLKRGVIRDMATILPLGGIAE